MNMIEIIQKKKRGIELTRSEIDWLIAGVTSGSIPDYQISAWLMAVCFNGMTGAETLALTMAMAHSGDTVDLSALPGVKGDKHSTGGVGDKTTLIVAPVCAACGVTMAKMSGRGLGHTGGTVDKLEAIPGFNTSLDSKEFFDVVNTAGLCVTGQSGNLAPADKKLYALRDVTATVESLPLIASSIMSKKLAAGSDCIVLDVKTGSGAFMKTTEDAVALARAMVDIGNGAGRTCAALVTDMERPLGLNIGNALEVSEAVDVLRGHGPEDLTEVCVALASALLRLAARREPQSFPSGKTESENAVKKAIASGAAFERLCAMVTAQGGDDSVLRDTSRLPRAKTVYPVAAPKSGCIYSMNTERIGMASVLLGAGRLTKNDTIDRSAGIVLARKTGDMVSKGETIAWLHTMNEEKARTVETEFLESIVISDEKPEDRPLIFDVID